MIFKGPLRIFFLHFYSCELFCKKQTNKHICTNVKSSQVTLSYNSESLESIPIESIRITFSRFYMHRHTHRKGRDTVWIWEQAFCNKGHTHLTVLTKSKIFHVLLFTKLQTCKDNSKGRTCSRVLRHFLESAFCLTVTNFSKLEGVVFSLFFSSGNRRITL